MIDLRTALNLLSETTISADQTVLIDDALCKAEAGDIPSAQVPDVLRYIDLQLAHNPVSEDTRQRLDLLHSSLQHRFGHS